VHPVRTLSVAVDLTADIVHPGAVSERERESERERVCVLFFFSSITLLL